MTPRQLHALRLRQIEQLQHSELMTGIVASVTANFSMMKPEPPFSAESFMIHKLPNSGEDDQDPDEEMDGDKILRILGGLPAGAAVCLDGTRHPSHSFDNTSAIRAFRALKHSSNESSP